MGNRRFAQVSTSDEEEEAPPKAPSLLTKTKPVNNSEMERKRKKIEHQEEEEEEVAVTRRRGRPRKKVREEKSEEEVEVEEVPQEDAKPAGVLTRVSGKGRGRRTHFDAFEFDGNRYELEDPVLLVPEDKEQKPYVAIIKDISQTKHGSLMVTGQWFYRPEEAERKGGGSWQSRDTRELFYSFHRDEVPAESVMHKCVVHFVPIHKQLPNRKQYPGFIVQKVYDTVERKLWKLTDKDYEYNKQHGIDLLVQKTLSRMGDLPDIEIEDAPTAAPEQDDPVKAKRTLRRKNVSPLDVTREEEATGRPDNLKAETPGSCPSNNSEYHAILVKFDALTGDTLRDKWLERLLQSIQYMCSSPNYTLDDGKLKGGSDGDDHKKEQKSQGAANGSEENSAKVGKSFPWLDAAVPAVSALEKASHDALSSDFQKYNQKLRQLAFNLKNNAFLARRLLNKELEPSKMLNMSPNELKEGLTAEETAKKEPDGSERMQMTDARCSRCSEFKVRLRDIIQAGHGARYQLECIACGNSWYASRDEVSMLLIDTPNSAKSVGTAPWATAKFDEVETFGIACYEREIHTRDKEALSLCSFICILKGSLPCLFLLFIENLSRERERAVCFFSCSQRKKEKTVSSYISLVNMMSLNRSIFLSNAGISSSSSPFTGGQRGSVPSVPSSLRVVAVNSNRDRNGSVLTETTRKDVRDGAASSSSVIDVDSKSTVAPGGPHDVYGEDAATEEQIVTPWFVSVASGYSLLRDPHHNKGLAFTDKERAAHYLRGLLPPAVVSQELQVKKLMHIIRQYQVPLQKYMAMMDLQESNEKLFYKLLIDNVEEMLPIVYTPTVGEACQKYGSIFGRPQGLYISLKEKGCIHEVLRNWPEKNIEVIVVTDGERILGLGDLGCQGMGIPVGKLALYTALGGVRPSACLPVTIDVGTNNENLLNDEYYIGLRQRRATGQEYAELLHEFMSAVKQTYGEKVLIQFEDFANHNAFDLLAKYSATHLVFNDDIQGTASVVLAGLVAALKVVGGTLADHTFLFLGAGEAGTGIAELIALEISKQTNMPVEETRKKVWLVDSKGLIVSSRRESLQHFKKPWAHEHEPVKTLLDAVNDIKPTVLIGTSGVGKTFTKEVIEAMASFNEKPIILSLSNPTSQSECTAEEAYTWSQGRAIFASGSPFAPFEYEGKTFMPGQANNAYIFPGLGLGLIMSGAIRVHDDMLLAASEALAAQVTQENFDKGLIYPPFKNIRKISAEIAAKVAAKAYELGLATRVPPPRDLVKHAESCMYSPSYRSYR